MNLLILGAALQLPSHYRGVDRNTPGYIGDVEETHPVNQLFFWSTTQFDDGYLHDLDKAKQLVDAYARLESPQRFEIIRVLHADEEADGEGEFLGYDLASYTSSVLSTGMRYCSHHPEIVYMPLLCLIEQHFKPHLNDNGLFAEEAKAAACLECMIALHHLVPDSRLWELHLPNTNLRVTGIHRLYSPL